MHLMIKICDIMMTPNLSLGSVPGGSAEQYIAHLQQYLRLISHSVSVNTPFFTSLVLRVYSVWESASLLPQMQHVEISAVAVH